MTPHANAAPASRPTTAGRDPGGASAAQVEGLQDATAHARSIARLLFDLAGPTLWPDGDLDLPAWLPEWIFEQADADDADVPEALRDGSSVAFMCAWCGAHLEVDRCDAAQLGPCPACHHAGPAQGKTWWRADVRTYTLRARPDLPPLGPADVEVARCRWHGPGGVAEGQPALPVPPPGGLQPCGGTGRHAWTEPDVPVTRSARCAIWTCPDCGLMWQVGRAVPGGEAR